MSSSTEIYSKVAPNDGQRPTHRRRTKAEKWLSDDNWIELIKAHHTNLTLTSLQLNAAIRKYYSTKNAVDLTDGVSNTTGIYRNTKQVNNRRVSHYYFTDLGSDVDESSWGNGAGVRTQKVCCSVPLGKYHRTRRTESTPFALFDSRKQTKSFKTKEDSIRKNTCLAPLLNSNQTFQTLPECQVRKSIRRSSRFLEESDNVQWTTPPHRSLLSPLS
jgi:hypothetical protein